MSQTPPDNDGDPRLSTILAILSGARNEDPSIVARRILDALDHVPGVQWPVTVAGNDLAEILDDHQLWMLAQPPDEQDWRAHDRLSGALDETVTAEELREGFAQIQEFLSNPETDAP